jgi:para-aminobenzoate synthetase component 1
VSGNEVSVFFDEATSSEAEATAIFKNCFQSQKINHSWSNSTVKIESRITKQEYIAAVKELQKHIRRGDIYEVNFCQEFYSENAVINTAEVYQNFNSISSAPFSAFCKFDNHYVLSSSPERFLQKRGNTLISQPIKGTRKRSGNSIEDNQLKYDLLNDTKERSENVMIVDIVRNDLSRIAKKGTVKVDELFGIYSFKQVHQMISTISCEVKESVSFSDIIRATFPMGSMTGAPKISAMKLIEQYESSKRGLYSGALGYISPDGDFDFSVVIRTILYNEEKKYLSFMVGSAITDKANAEQEYEECMLKAKAMFEVLQN